MKTVEELGISPIPWWIGKEDELFFYGSIVCNTKDGKKIIATSNYSFDCHKADDLIMVAAPEMYEQLRQSTNMIEHVIQFLGKVPEIQNGLRELAKKNRAVLGKAAGEIEVK